PASFPSQLGRGKTGISHRASRKRSSRFLVLVGFDGRGGCLRSLVDERLEACGIVDRDVGEDLAINLNAEVRQTVDKSAVSQAVLADGGVDALNPECAEVALAALAVAISVLLGLFDSLL